MGVTRVRIGALDVEILYRNNAITVVQRQRSNDKRADHRERSRADRDRYSQRDTADQRETRVLHQHAQAQPAIERQAVQPVEPARVPHQLLVPLDTTECDQCAATCLFRRHAGSELLLHLQTDVELELLVQLALHLATPHYGAHTLRPTSPPAHHGFLNFTLCRESARSTRRTAASSLLPDRARAGPHA